MANFNSVFGEKNAEDIAAICSSFFKFAASYRDVWYLAGLSAALGILIWIMHKGLWKPYIKIVGFSVLVYFLYQLGTLAMYIFSMPIGEAVVLASAERYTNTVLIAILYLNMVPVMMLLGMLKGETGKTIAASVCVFALTMGLMYADLGTIKVVFQNEPHAEERNYIEAVKAEYHLPLQGSYFMPIPENDNGFSWYLLRYTFQTNDVAAVVVESYENLEYIQNYEYILVYDYENKIIKDWIMKNFPEQYGNEVIIQW